MATAALMTALLFSSCQFSKGVKKDLATGLTATYNGFSIDDIYLSDENNQQITSNVVELGTQIKVIANGVNNYVVKDGRVFPGCLIVLTDNHNNELLRLPDAFDHLAEGKLKEEASVLTASLNTGSPMQEGATYHLHVKFWDKLKPTNHITADVNLVMKKNPEQ